MKQKAIAVMKLTKDSIQNQFTRLGTAMDKHRANMPTGRGFLFSEDQMDELYYDSTLMRRIIDRPARDAMKRGFEVRFDDPKLQDYVEKELKRLRADRELTKALRLARKNGGAGIVIMDDTRDREALAQPPRENAKIKKLRTHSRWSLIAGERENRYDDDNWDLPRTYSLPGHTAKVVHHARVVRLVGLEVDDHKRADYNGWGQSWTEACWPAYSDLSTCSYSLATQMHDAIYNVLRMKNLPGLLSRKEGRTLLDDRIEIINEGKSLLRTLILDIDEEYDVVAKDLSKLIEPYDIFAQQLSADTNIPLTILFGQAPKGWSSTDVNAIESYYEFLETIQADDLEPAIMQIVNAILLQKGIRDVEFSVWWPPIEKPDELTQAQVRNTTVQTDIALYSIGAMDAEEIRSRHYGEGFQFDLTLEESGLTLPSLPNAEGLDEPAPITEQEMETLVADAMARQRPGARSTMICLAPPPEWTARFRDLFPDAQPMTHLTLKYCGHLTDAELISLIAEFEGEGSHESSLTEIFADSGQQVNIKISGHGAFYANGKYCEVLLVSPSQGLQSLQATVSEWARNVSGVPKHDFIPHITVNYHDAPFVAKPVEVEDFPEWTACTVLIVQEDELVAEFRVL